VIAALKRHGLIDGAIRAPQPGAPFAYVTTKRFLEAFGLGTLRDLPDLERLKTEGLMQRDGGEALDAALGLGDAEDDGDEDGGVFPRESEEFDTGADF
jgi:segregation and condensation protein B